jgi:hypothetical protein
VGDYAVTKFCGLIAAGIFDQVPAFSSSGKNRQERKTRVGATPQAGDNTKAAACPVESDSGSLVLLPIVAAVITLCCGNGH